MHNFDPRSQPSEKQACDQYCVFDDGGDDDDYDDDDDDNDDDYDDSTIGWEGVTGEVKQSLLSTIEKPPVVQTKTNKQNHKN